MHQARDLWLWCLVAVQVVRLPMATEFYATKKRLPIILACIVWGQLWRDQLRHPGTYSVNEAIVAETNSGYSHSSRSLPNTNTKVSMESPSTPATRLAVTQLRPSLIASSTKVYLTGCKRYTEFCTSTQLLPFPTYFRV